MRTAVIGAGWAGLTAAWTLHRQGHTVALFEAARNLGGRARRVHSRSLGLAIDNGQHILLGAYTETQALMRELGLDPGQLFHRERLALQSADGAFKLGALPLPAPLHLLGGVLAASGLSMKERLGLVGLVTGLRMRGWTPAAGLSVRQWLEQGRQSSHVVRSFWQPLCLAALNTPMEDACALLFAHVLRDSLGGTGAASDVLIPRVDLSRLWPDELARQLCEQGSHETALHLAHAVRELGADANGVNIDGMVFDAVIVAGNTPSTLRLLKQLDATSGSQPYLGMLSAFDFVPIATLTLQLEQPWRLPRPMMLLCDDPGKLQFGQWLFERSCHEPLSDGASVASTGAAKAANLLHIVISDARALQEHPQDDVVNAIVRQVRTQAARFGAMPGVVGHDLIIEKRATFAARPGLARPGVATPWPRVWVAGDWTDTGYPGVLEGAVRSGRAAARSLMDSLARAR